MVSKAELQALLVEVLPELLQAQYGIDLHNVAPTLSSLEKLQQERTEKLWKQIIGKEGKEYEQAVKAVQDHFSKLPEKMQEALDNEEGLKYIWSQVQGSLSQQDASAQSYLSLDDSPLAEGETTVTQAGIDLSPGRIWKDAEIDDLYARGFIEKPGVMEAVQLAYAEGRVN